MTGRGGAEGYLFTGIRVMPAEGRVEARGKFARKKEKEKEKSNGEGLGKGGSAGLKRGVEGEGAQGEENCSPPKKVKVEVGTEPDAGVGVEVKEEEQAARGPEVDVEESTEVQMAES